jgi:Mycothiol maleylpyruvate isomerase N-terminal domain
MTEEHTMDREELLQQEDTAWSAFIDAFASMSDDRREVEGVVPGWSVKDLVWHCGYWADWVGDYLERDTAGQQPPPEQDWDKLNQMVFEDGRGLSWDEVIIAAERGRDRARSALLAVGEVTDRAASEFRDETVVHYDEHAAEIRSFGAAG